MCSEGYSGLSFKFAWGPGQQLTMHIIAEIVRNCMKKLDRSLTRRTASKLKLSMGSSRIKVRDFQQLA